MKASISIASMSVESIDIKGFKIEFQYTAEELTTMYEKSPAMFAALSSLIQSFNKE